MSEWELIECFRQMIQGHRLPYLELGSGYQTDVDLNNVNEANGVFLHSYLRDTVIGSQWFQDQGIPIDARIWQKSLAWYDTREVQKLI